MADAATMTDAAQIRFAEAPPAMCSSCFGQYPHRKHIDFGASWDGPVLQGAHPVSIDELILCETCVRAAAKLLRLTDSPNARTLERQRAVIADQEEKLHRLAEYIETLNATIAANPAITFGDTDGTQS